MELPIIILVIVVISAIVTSVFASFYTYLYFKRNRELSSSQTFDPNTVGFVQKELRSAVHEAIAQIEPKLIADKKLNELIHERIDQTLVGVKNETIDKVKDETGEFQDDYKSAISDLKSMYQTLGDESLKEIQGIIKNEFSDFKKIIESQTVQSQKVIGERIDEAYENALKEIDEYKREKIELIDKVINERAASILREVLGDSLTINDHEKLLRDATDKAIQNGFFKKI